jgi:hypothetical protein
MHIRGDDEFGRFHAQVARIPRVNASGTPGSPGFHSAETSAAILRRRHGCCDLIDASIPLFFRLLRQPPLRSEEDRELQISARGGGRTHTTFVGRF